MSSNASPLTSPAPADDDPTGARFPDEVARLLPGPSGSAIVEEQMPERRFEAAPEDTSARVRGVNPSGTVVVIGSGQAGFQVAASLREERFEGRVVVVGEEGDPPYQRPPLSKGFLTGKTDEAALRLRADAFYADHGIELRAGEQAVAIDRERRAVEFATGERLGYDHLVLATGARNRLLPVPGATLDGVSSCARYRTRKPSARACPVCPAWW
jgi:hypothetical protein